MVKAKPLQLDYIKSRSGKDIIEDEVWLPARQGGKGDFARMRIGARSPSPVVVGEKARAAFIDGMPEMPLPGLQQTVRKTVMA